MNLFVHLNDLLSQTDKVTFTVNRRGDGDLSVIITPHYAPDEQGSGKGKNKELVADCHTMLAMPFVVHGKAEELDERLPKDLNEYIQTRASLTNSSSMLDQMKDTARKASSKINTDKKPTDDKDQAKKGTAQSTEQASETSQSDTKPATTQDKSVSGDTDDYDL